MSYDDRFGITEIRSTRHDNLQVSRDDMGEGVIAVLLFTPSMDDTVDHHHIELNRGQAKHLRDWLTRFVDENPKALK